MGLGCPYLVCNAENKPQGLIRTVQINYTRSKNFSDEPLFVGSLQRLPCKCCRYHPLDSKIDMQGGALVEDGQFRACQRGDGVFNHEAVFRYQLIMKSVELTATPEGEHDDIGNDKVREIPTTAGTNDSISWAEVRLQTPRELSLGLTSLLLMVVCHESASITFFLFVRPRSYKSRYSHSVFFIQNIFKPLR